MEKKRVAVLQSNYIPWKGYFDIIHDVDLFIFTMTCSIQKMIGEIAIKSLYKESLYGSLYPLAQVSID